MTPHDVLVRAATPADADAVATMFVEGGGGTHEEHRAGFSGELATALPDNLILVAEVEGRVAGWARARHVGRAADPPANAAPAGWYLLGLRVAAADRRRGIGRALTAYRLDWIARRADEAFYFTKTENHASAALHAEMGFVEVSRDFTVPGIPLPGEQVLYRVDLSGRR